MSEHDGYVNSVLLKKSFASMLVMLIFMHLLCLVSGLVGEHTCKNEINTIERAVKS